MSKYVVDASVAVKWLLQEEVASEAALRLLNAGHNLLVPDLFFPEVGNILWKRVRRGDDTPEQAREYLAELRAGPLELHKSEPLMPLALDIAMQTDRTVYDSLYLALAISNECQLVTADLRFYNALRNSSFAGNLLWVEDV